MWLMLMTVWRCCPTDAICRQDIIVLTIAAKLAYCKSTIIFVRRHLAFKMALIPAPPIRAAMLGKCANLQSAPAAACEDAKRSASAPLRFGRPMKLPNHGSVAAASRNLECGVVSGPEVVPQGILSRFNYQTPRSRGAIATKSDNQLVLLGVQDSGP